MPEAPQLVIGSYDELYKFTGLRRSQIKELMANGRFPNPVKLSERRKVWFAHSVAAWQAERVAEQVERERVVREQAERDADRAERNRPNRST